MISVGCIDGKTKDVDIANVFGDKVSLFSVISDALNDNDDIMNDSALSFS